MSKFLPIDLKTLTSYVTSVTPTRCDIELNWELVKKKIKKSSNPNKATGPDLVSLKDLKLLGESSIHSLLPVFKKSIDDTVFPTNWKLSHVKPVFKKGAPTDMSNFRPISLLSIPGTILEDIISNSIDNHIEAEDLLSDNQWGFCKNHSTEGFLLHLTDTWKWALDKNLKVGVLFIDFRKAFDSVNHTILLQKLKQGSKLKKMFGRKFATSYENLVATFKTYIFLIEFLKLSPLIFLKNKVYELFSGFSEVKMSLKIDALVAKLIEAV